MAEPATLEHQHDHETEDQLWEGGKEPFKASYGKLMMWYFLLTDAFTFAGFLIAYGALRFSSPTWPVADVVFEKIPFFSDVKAPLVFVTFMTFEVIRRLSQLVAGRGCFRRKSAILQLAGVRGAVLVVFASFSHVFRSHS